jgi:hypothetical protein
MTVQWLEACADKWADDPEKFAQYRGFSLFDVTSLTNIKQLTDESAV